MEISSVGLVGLGVMGRSISEMFATNGFMVSVVDVSEELTAKGIQAVDGSLAKAVSRGRMSSDKRTSILSRIRPRKINELRDEDLVIECVSEVIDTKKAVLKELDLIAREDAFLASNTSSFSISELSTAVRESRIVLGMHFFNPVWSLPLVELVLPERVSPHNRQSLRDFLTKNGRVVVEVRDSPGFVVNRLLFAMMAESLALHDEGVASREDIDLAMKKGANLPMGPFELMDYIGIDVVKEILDNLSTRLGNKSMGESLRTLAPLLEKGWLGRKSGRGFYGYDK